METIGYLDKAMRDERFDQLRRQRRAELSVPRKNRQRTPESRAVKFSTAEFSIDEVTGEISLDNRGRVRYHTVWAITYPSN